MGHPQNYFRIIWILVLHEGKWVCVDFKHNMLQVQHIKRKYYLSYLGDLSKICYYICTEIYCKMNMSNKNDALQSTRNLIGCTIFLTSEKYRMTNHNPQTKVFTSDKNRIDFPAFH